MFCVFSHVMYALWVREQLSLIVLTPVAMGHEAGGCIHLKAWWGWGPISKVAHSRGWQAGAGWWPGASVLLHVGRSLGLLQCPHNVAADFPQRE